MDAAKWVRTAERLQVQREICEWSTLPERFWEKISMNTSGCWNWTGCLVASCNLLYGRFGVKNISFPAHKVMYLVTFGNVPHKWEVHHECRNTTCVNPSHLRAITKRENILLSNSAGGINSR